ncbi:MAG: hypothetical protein PHE54_02265 [Bacilli bacterium]|nr:hypothetical protein [Bacilli bacterium]
MKLDKVKVFYQNPRSRALITLGLYGIFFIAVILIYGSKQTANVLTILENYNLDTTYYFKVDGDVNYDGVRYNDQITFLYDDVKYQYDKEMELPDLVKITIILTPQEIYKLLSENDMISKTYLYENNLTAKAYKVETNMNFNDYIDGEYLIITTYENDEQITKINLQNESINIDITYDYEISENDFIEWSK